jgi:small-conductance mechanosensitive channel
MIIEEIFIISVLKSLVIFLTIVCAFRLIELIILEKLFQRIIKSCQNIFCSLIKALKKSWCFLSILVASYVSLLIFPASQTFQDGIQEIFLVLLVFYFTWMAHRLIGCQTELLIADRKERRRNVTSLKFFNRIFDIFLWLGAILIVISILGYDIRVLLAGLGIGSVLFAIASQKMLSDLFVSFAIYSDHVFEEGDFIVIGDYRGAPGKARGRIERIGLRSTQLRGPGGEIIVLPNQELASTVIYNYSKKREAKMSLNFSVAYDVPLESLNKIDDIAREVLEGQESATRGQVNFQSFGSNGPIFELVYDLETTDYEEMQNIHRQIALVLKERLGEHGIKIARG